MTRWLSLVFAGSLGVFGKVQAPKIIGHDVEIAPRGTLTTAPDAKEDAMTGLPMRVIHKPSGITLVLISAGEFMMGSPTNEPDRGKGERQHRRVIRKAFYMGETEVTTAQFRRFADATGYKTDAERGTDDGNGRGVGSFASMQAGNRDWHVETNWRNPFPILKDLCPREDHPVTHVSWNDAQAFVSYFGLGVPSEAQWEYAARAGTRTRFYWGEEEADGKHFENVGDESRRRRFPSANVIFPFDDGFAMLAPVKRFRPNPWGLYDMLGNVEEWCQDSTGNYPEEGADESPNLAKALGRIMRGGSWLGNSGHTRAAARIGMPVAARRDFQGFRVVAPIEAAR